MREPFEKTKIQFEIETCGECPFVRDIYTIGAGRAYDYHCTYGRNYDAEQTTLRTYPKVMYYVEYSRDENPVPEWCPIRVKE